MANQDVLVTLIDSRRLSPAQYQGLADVRSPSCGEAGHS